MNDPCRKDMLLRESQNSANKVKFGEESALKSSLVSASQMQDSEMPDDEESNYINESQYDPQLEKKIL